MQHEFAVIIQARMSSRRFPAKMMYAVAGVPLVDYVYKRCRLLERLQVVVATSLDESDNEMVAYCQSRAIPVFRGPLDNVLSRYLLAAKALDAEFIARVCADTPFVDLVWINEFFRIAKANKLEYVSFNRQDCSPGFYSEIIRVQALQKVASKTIDKADLQHVSRYIINNPGQFQVEFPKAGLNPDYLKQFRITVDYPEDLNNVNKIIGFLPDPYVFSSGDVLAAVKKIVGGDLPAG